MFGLNKKSTTVDNAFSGSEKPSSKPTNKICVIAKGTVIEGTFYSESDTRVDGTILGKVTCEARIMMGKDAQIEGEVKTQDIAIKGSFKGDLRVTDVLHLDKTAVVNGTILANKLSVEPGAKLQGECSVGSSAKVEKQQSNFKKTDNNKARKKSA